MPQQDLCHVLGQFAATTSYDHLPGDAVEGAKRSILDILGVILAASGMEPASRHFVELALENGGKPESLVLVSGVRIPAAMAAFANGAMAHSLDYDDQTPWGQHASSALVPAVLAIAERRGNVSGRELIAAITIGQDVFNRLRQHVEWKKDWFFSTIIGVYSATAAVGSILRLTPQQIANALGIASLQSAGTTEMINATGSDLRAVYAGFPAKGAVLAGLLAQRGLGGVPTLFEGRHGVMKLYFGGQYDRERIVAGLGEDFTGGRTLYKRWPAVGTAHSHIHAMIGLMKEHHLDISQIDQILVYVGDYHQLMCEPLPQRQAPSTLVDAKFSLPYLVAVAAIRRDMSLRDFTEDALKDQDVLATARKVLPVPDASLDWKLELPSGRVEIVTSDGRRFTRVGADIPGSPEAPMGWDDLVSKFIDCASFSARPLSEEQILGVHTLVGGLEAMSDASELTRLLA